MVQAHLKDEILCFSVFSNVTQPRNTILQAEYLIYTSTHKKDIFRQSSPYTTTQTQPFLCVLFSNKMAFSAMSGLFEFGAPGLFVINPSLVFNWYNNNLVIL